MHEFSNRLISKESIAGWKKGNPSTCNKVLTADKRLGNMLGRLDRVQ
jgi:hypothetical protein